MTVGRVNGSPDGAKVGRELKSVINHTLVAIQIGYRSRYLTNSVSTTRLVYRTPYRPSIWYNSQVKYLIYFSHPIWALRERDRGRLCSSVYDDERHNLTLKAQQRNIFQGGQNAHIQAYVYSIVSSFFLGRSIRLRNAFATQPKLHDACHTVCQCRCVQNCFSRHRVYLHHHTAPPAA